MGGHRGHVRQRYKVTTCKMFAPLLHEGNVYTTIYITSQEQIALREMWWIWIMFFTDTIRKCDLGIPTHLVKIRGSCLTLKKNNNNNLKLETRNHVTTNSTSDCFRAHNEPNLVMLNSPNNNFVIMSKTKQNKRDIFMHAVFWGFCAFYCFSLTLHMQKNSLLRFD